jgi:hypothetical protein
MVPTASRHLLQVLREKQVEVFGPKVTARNSGGGFEVDALNAGDSGQERL